MLPQPQFPPPLSAFFFDRRPVPFGGSRCIETYSSTTSRSRPRTRGNRSAASCLCTVLRRALYHYSTRSPSLTSASHTRTRTTLHTLAPWIHTHYVSTSCKQATPLPCTEGSLTFETSIPTWVSVQDVVLKKQKTIHANQVNQSQSSATLPHTDKQHVSAHVAVFLVDVSLP